MKKSRTEFVSWASLDMCDCAGACAARFQSTIRRALALMWVVTGLSSITARGEPTAEGAWKLGVEHFYNFEFAEALPYLRDAFKSSGRSESNPKYRYWLSKALWVRMLDEQVDINQDFMTAVLEKNLADPGLVSKDLKEEFSALTGEGIELGNRQLQNTPGKIEALYYLAAFRSNLAAYKLLVDGRRFGALSDLKQSMRGFQRVLERDSSNLLALTALGMAHYMVGSSPWYVRMFNPILGLEGTRSQGLSELESAAKLGNTDAKFMLKAALAREHRVAEALVLLQELSKSYPRNIPFRLQLAQVLASLGRREEAKELFEEVLRRVATDRTVDRRYTPAKVKELARQSNVTSP